MDHDLFNMVISIITKLTEGSHLQSQDNNEFLS